MVGVRVTVTVRVRQSESVIGEKTVRVWERTSAPRLIDVPRNRRVTWKEID